MAQAEIDTAESRVIIVAVAAAGNTCPGSCRQGSSRWHPALVLVGGDQAWHTRGQSFRRAGSVPVAAALPRPAGRRPFRCSRGLPYQKAQSRLFAGVDSPVVGLARYAKGLRPVAEEPCSLETAACTLALTEDSTCSVGSGTAGSTLPTVGSVARSSHSPGCQKEVCSLGSLG